MCSFASSVAPFGGFFASAIKRAYGIKDFDSFIPGHGRMDALILVWNGLTCCRYRRAYGSFGLPVDHDGLHICILSDVCEAVYAQKTRARYRSQHCRFET